jgi:hypothetical protein
MGKDAGGVTQAGEYLASKHEVLCSYPSTTKKYPKTVRCVCVCVCVVEYYSALKKQVTSVITDNMHESRGN